MKLEKTQELYSFKSQEGKLIKALKDKGFEVSGPHNDQLFGENTQYIITQPLEKSREK